MREQREHPTPSPAPASGAETCKHRHAYGCTCGYCITGGCTLLHAKPARPTPPSDAGTSERETGIPPTCEHCGHLTDSEPISFSLTFGDRVYPMTCNHAVAPAAEGPRLSDDELFAQHGRIRMHAEECPCGCGIDPRTPEYYPAHAEKAVAALPGAEPLTQLKQLHEKMQRADRYYEDHPDSYGAMCDAEAASDDFWSAVAARLASPSPTGAPAEQQTHEG